MGATFRAEAFRAMMRTSSKATRETLRLRSRSANRLRGWTTASCRIHRARKASMCSAVRPEQSEPLFCADHATLDEDTLEAMTTWWENGVAFQHIQRRTPTATPRSSPATTPCAKKSKARSPAPKKLKTPSSAAKKSKTPSFAAKTSKMSSPAGKTSQKTPFPLTTTKKTAASLTRGANFPSPRRRILAGVNTSSKSPLAARTPRFGASKLTPCNPARHQAFPSPHVGSPCTTGSPAQDVGSISRGGSPVARKLHFDFEVSHATANDITSSSYCRDPVRANSTPTCGISSDHTLTAAADNTPVATTSLTAGHTPTPTLTATPSNRFRNGLAVTGLGRGESHLPTSVQLATSSSLPY